MRHWKHVENVNGNLGHFSTEMKPVSMEWTAHDNDQKRACVRTLQMQLLEAIIELEEI